MSIATRIENMTNNLENAYNNIEDLGIDLTNINKNLENLSTVLEEVYENYPKVSGTGTDITLNNTAKGKMEIDLSGRTEQESLSGANLTEYDELTLPVSSDLTLCDFGDGKSFTKLSITIICDNNSFSSENSSFIGYTDENDQFHHEALNRWWYPYSKTSPVTGTFTRVLSNITAKSIILKNWCNLSGKIKLQIQEGEPTDWEPYCGGISAPNSGYECPIKNVTGNANIKIQNKNLFNVDEFIAEARDKGYTENQVSKTTYLGKEVLKYKNNLTNLRFMQGQFKENTRYTFKTAVSRSGYVSGESPYIQVVYTDGTRKYFSINNTDNTFIYSTIITDTNKTIDYINVTNYGDGQFIYLDLSVTQLEEGTTATSYVPYKEQNYPFTFAEGQRGMQGTKLLDDGIHQKHKQKIFDGTENWYQFGKNVALANWDNRETPTHTDASLQGYKCNIAIETTGGSREKTDYTFVTYNFNVSDFIVFHNNMSVADWKAYLAEQYANGTPVTIEYELAESELESNIIPYNSTQASQYEAIKNARSYDDITYITSTSDELGFDMDVESLADANKVAPILDATALLDSNS